MVYRQWLTNTTACSYKVRKQWAVSYNIQTEWQRYWIFSKVSQCEKVSSSLDQVSGQWVSGHLVTMSQSASLLFSLIIMDQIISRCWVISLTKLNCLRDQVLKAVCRVWANSRTYHKIWRQCAIHYYLKSVTYFLVSNAGCIAYYIIETESCHKIWRQCATK